MRMRCLLPLLLAPALVACSGAGEPDQTDSTTADDTTVQGPALTPETRLEGILHVVNDMSRDDLLSEAHVEPGVADAIIAAREDGFRFTTEQQVDDLLDGAVPRAEDAVPMAGGPLCAYSVCAPMTPWYGYMAEYYRGLVEAFCS